ncbi:dihydroneopterin aldolase [Bartonella sp. DGB1]|uniref:dihydroneopterin aldolase n=1 Tax=Bartonella sp. DGB1 TaxID=3239807 RepID=UPI0035242486
MTKILLSNDYLNDENISLVNRSNDILEFYLKFNDIDNNDIDNIVKENILFNILLEADELLEKKYDAKLKLLQSLKDIYVYCDNSEKVKQLLVYKNTELIDKKFILLCPITIMPEPIEFINSIFTGVTILVNENNNTAFERSFLPFLFNKNKAFNKCNLTLSIAGYFELADIPRCVAVGIENIFLYFNENIKISELLQVLTPAYLIKNQQLEEARDRIFVKDYCFPMVIGAYAYEQKNKQNVFFDITVEITKQHYRQIRKDQIFSYDIIIDAIHIFAAQENILFVENLAQDIADYLLKTNYIWSVEITISKDRVIDGRVGVNIRRDYIKEYLT